LDRAAEKNRHYRATLKEQDKAYDELYKAGLDREHMLFVHPLQAPWSMTTSLMKQ